MICTNLNESCGENEHEGRSDKVVSRQQSMVNHGFMAEKMNMKEDQIKWYLGNRLW